MVSEEELKARRASWKPYMREVKSPFLRRYRRFVASGVKGAVLLDE